MTTINFKFRDVEMTDMWGVEIDGKVYKPEDASKILYQEIMVLRDLIWNLTETGLDGLCEKDYEKVREIMNEIASENPLVQVMVELVKHGASVRAIDPEDYEQEPWEWEEVRRAHAAKKLN